MVSKYSFMTIGMKNENNIIIITLDKYLILRKTKYRYIEFQITNTKQVVKVKYVGLRAIINEQ